MKSGPLSGIRVLDMTAVVLGPMATHILADYGAEIIKVEPLEGDLIRANGVSVHRGMSSIHLALNRNKRSLALDLKSPEGREILQRLIPRVDVLVHNMRVRAIERLGFGYERVRELNPGIIYCFATGFGQDGPYRDKPAFDDIIQSASGLVGLNRANLGAAQYAPTLLADKTIGVYLANAVLAGLVHRLRSGEGQSIEVPMFETMAAFVLTEHLGGYCFEPQTEPFGYARVLAGGRRPIPTLDGHVSMLPYTEHHWTAFLREAGHEDAIERYQVRNRHERNRHIKPLYALLASIVGQRTTAHWIEVCERLDIPATPIYDLEALPEHPHLKAVGLFQQAEHPSEGPIRYLRPTMKFSQSPPSVRHQAPLLGADNDAILGELGYSRDEIDRLRTAGAIAAKPESGSR
jgi:crotonobetainyl-CoA:carnitine CoA-transferase CaiB-like acyl-CoA transferase